MNDNIMSSTCNSQSVTLHIVEKWSHYTELIANRKWHLVTIHRTHAHYMYI